MSDLTPTPNFPGIRIGQEGPYGAAYADYACRCGQSASTTAGGSVAALVQDYTDNHGPAHRKEGRT
ncbi:hypothetical protein OG727_18180 [Streptomyces caniferus]|uniref:Uncharacterized protein n=1 Tax=Streptomyces caniferus TaxID=285557 RepID=A0ABZ1VL81_9ACTN|nr:hypothetical protein [Streptomyces caniferus]